MEKLTSNPSPVDNIDPDLVNDFDLSLLDEYEAYRRIRDDTIGGRRDGKPGRLADLTPEELNTMNSDEVVEHALSKRGDYYTDSRPGTFAQSLDEMSDEQFERATEGFIRHIDSEQREAEYDTQRSAQEAERRERVDRYTKITRAVGGIATAGAVYLEVTGKMPGALRIPMHMAGIAMAYETAAVSANKVFRKRAEKQKAEEIEVRERQQLEWQASKLEEEKENLKSWFGPEIAELDEAIRQSDGNTTNDLGVLEKIPAA